MQFGLDACCKENACAVFSMSAGNNPRKRVEAKSYRARDHGDNGWYRHDDGSPAGMARATPVKRFRQECCCRCGSQISEPAVGGSTPSSAAVTMTPKSASRAEGRRNRDHVMGYGHSTEWYGNSQCTPNKDEADSSRSRHHGVLSLRKREFYPNSKDWFKHEHTILVVDNEEMENDDHVRSKKMTDICSSPSWWPKEGEGTVVQSPRPRLMGSDAERYWQRDHDGSANDWFRHEHADEKREDASGGRESDGDNPIWSTSDACQSNVCCNCRQTGKLQSDAQTSQTDEKMLCRSRQALCERFLQAE